jgi:hypothetical protein
MRGISAWNLGGVSQESSVIRSSMLRNVRRPAGPRTQTVS